VDRLRGPDRGADAQCRDERLDSLHQQRVLEVDSVFRPALADALGDLYRVERETDDGDDDRRDEPRERPGDADVEQRFSGRNVPTDVDDGTHRPEQGGKRDEVRKGDVDTVVPGGGVVAQLVDAQHAEHRDDEGPGLEDSQGLVGDRDIVPAARAHEQRRGDGRYEQPDVEPRNPAALLGFGHQRVLLCLLGPEPVAGRPNWRSRRRLYGGRRRWLAFERQRVARLGELRSERLDDGVGADQGFAEVPDSAVALVDGRHVKDTGEFAGGRRVVAVTTHRLPVDGEDINIPCSGPRWRGTRGCDRYYAGSIRQVVALV